MPNNQNPVYTDNSTILGDGTVEDPLFAAGSGSVTDVESTDDSVTVTNGAGPVVDLSIAPTADAEGDIPVWTGTRFQEQPNPGAFRLQANGAGGSVFQGISTSSNDSTAIMLLENVGGADNLILNAGSGAGGGLGPFFFRQDGSMHAGGLHVNFSALQIFLNNAAAIAGGLLAGDLYRSGTDPDAVFIVH